MRRRNNVATWITDETFDSITSTSWTWQLFTGAGVASFVIDKEGLLAAVGIAAAHSGDQYCLGHAGGAASVPLSHQDTPLPWASLALGDILTFSAWATYRSDLPGNSAVTLWLNFWDDLTGGADGSINSAPFDISSTGASARRVDRIFLEFRSHPG
jgi:hypothetical protein